MIDIHDHPLLQLGALTAELPGDLETIDSPQWLTDRLSVDCEAPLKRSDDLKTWVRNLLRYGGFKPSGRNKPASEYLVKAVADGRLGSINPAVDVCNVVSLHSGLPISVVDLDRTQGPLSVKIAAPDSEYIFNASGQVLKTDGLICLHDVEGPCANAVKDAQRTKTSGSTRNILVLIWGVNAFPEQTTAALDWYSELLEKLGCNVSRLVG